MSGGRIAWVFGGGALVGAVCAVGGGVPIFVMAAEFGSWAVSVVPALAFIAWCIPLMRGSDAVPIRTIALIPLTAAGSLAWYVTGWEYGDEYQGPVYTLVAAMLSAALGATTAAFAWAGRRRPSFPKGLTAHVALFSWMFSCAFPYLGETP